MATTTREYTRVSGDEFDAFIRSICPAAEIVEGQNVREVMYDLPLPSDEISIRVFSTIQNGKARDLGMDAIRCVIWNHTVDEPVGGEKKTLRIKTWRENLEPKIKDLYANWRSYDHGTCPRCNDGVLVERCPTGSQDWDPFLACTNWDGGRGCEYTGAL